MAFKNPFTLTESVRGVGAPDAIVTAIERLQFMVRLRFGMIPESAVDQYVSRRDLIDGGIIAAPATGYQASGPIIFPPDAGGSGGSTPIDTPTTPTGLAVTGAAKTNILMWDAPGFSGFAYTEIWKSSSNSLGSATLARTTVARVDADSIGSSGVTRYYWIRHVNQLGVPGPYNGVSGTAGTTGSASGAAETAAFDALIVARGVIVSALIGDAEITTAKIADASITNAKIASLSVSKLTAGALSVGQYIQSSNWGSGTGWKINEDGTAFFNQVYVTGEIHAANFTGTHTLTSSTFNDGTFVGNLVRNAANTTFINLAATGSSRFLQVGSAVTQWDGSSHSQVEINADGTAFFGNVVISRPNIVATGRVYEDGGTGYVVSVIDYPASSTTASWLGSSVFDSPSAAGDTASGP